MTQDEERVDWERALKSVQGRRELLAELVEIFLEECPKLLQAIAGAIESNTGKDLTISAHRLKGGLRYFGDSLAAERSFELEVMGREQSLAGAEAKFEDLKKALDRLLPKLREGP